MISDWLSAATLIKTRVTAQVTGLARVQVASGLQEAAAIVTENKSAYVCWAGDQVADYAGRGAASVVMQRWQVIVAVRPGESAGTLLSSIITALQGHELSDLYDVMRFLGGSAAVYNGDFALYPLTFEVAVYAG